MSLIAVPEEGRDRRSLVGRRRSGMLLVGLGMAVGARSSLAGGAGASSLPAAVVFALALAGLALAGGWKPGRLRWPGVALGAFGGAVVAAGPLVSNGLSLSRIGSGGGSIGLWVVVVSMVALAEEVLFRGALWGALLRESGSPVALLVTTVVFAVIHVPLYGWRAVPLDVGVGLGLGALRLWSGGVTAPAVAHLLADIAGGLL